MGRAPLIIAKKGGFDTARHGGILNKVQSNFLIRIFRFAALWRSIMNRYRYWVLLGIFTAGVELWPLAGAWAAEDRDACAMLQKGDVEAAFSPRKLDSGKPGYAIKSTHRADEDRQNRGSPIARRGHVFHCNVILWMSNLRHDTYVFRCREHKVKPPRGAVLLQGLAFFVMDEVRYDSRNSPLSVLLCSFSFCLPP